MSTKGCFTLLAFILAIFQTSAQVDCSCGTSVTEWQCTDYNGTTYQGGQAGYQDCVSSRSDIYDSQVDCTYCYKCTGSGSLGRCECDSSYNCSDLGSAAAAISAVIIVFIVIGVICCLICGGGIIWCIVGGAFCCAQASKPRRQPQQTTVVTTTTQQPVQQQANIQYVDQNGNPVQMVYTQQQPVQQQTTGY